MLKDSFKNPTIRVELGKIAVPHCFFGRKGGGQRVFLGFALALLFLFLALPDAAARDPA